MRHKRTGGLRPVLGSAESGRSPQAGVKWNGGDDPRGGHFRGNTQVEIWTDLPVISMNGLGRERDAEYKGWGKAGQEMARRNRRER